MAKKIIDRKNKEGRIEITALRPIPLSDIAGYHPVKGILNIDDIAKGINLKPAIVELQLKSGVIDFIREKKIDVEVKDVKFSSIDKDTKVFDLRSKKVIQGVVYFKFKLIGTEEALRKICGDGKRFLYDWEKKHNRKPLTDQVELNS